MSMSGIEGAQSGGGGEHALAAGGLFAGVLAALAASACCVLPAALVAAGGGFALLAPAEALQAYQPALMAGAGLFLGLGFWQDYRKSKACAGGMCRRPAWSRLSRGMLWMGSAMFAMSLAMVFWGPTLASYL
jgi:mercuric ion transport protein